MTELHLERTRKTGNSEIGRLQISGPSVNSSETQDMAILKPRASRMPYRALGPPPDRYSIDMSSCSLKSLLALHDSSRPGTWSSIGTKMKLRCDCFVEKYGSKLVGATYFLVKSVE
ncbi:hypothetical protein C8J56DRAFT_1052781 [Mycena floridula]|nr:hypothetical protein C8J56DRAFT_1052781 [Mycena floridula]